MAVNARKTRSSCTDLGIHRLHATPEVGLPFDGLRRGLLAPGGTRHHRELRMNLQNWL